MAEYLSCIIPVVIMLIVYFVRLESRFAKITQDLCWIKKAVAKCQRSSENLSL
jgi:hypothetical protein